MTLYPHPNYLKVIHSYTWFVYICFALYLSISFSTAWVSVSINCILLGIPIFIIHKRSIRFSKQKYVFDCNELVFPEQFSFSEISFSSFFLEKAYGVGTLHIDRKKIKGISIEDYNRFKCYLEDE